VKYILRIEIESQEIHCFYLASFFLQKLLKHIQMQFTIVNGGKNITMKYWSNLGIGWYQI